MSPYSKDFRGCPSVSPLGGIVTRANTLPFLYPTCGTFPPVDYLLYRIDTSSESRRVPYIILSRSVPLSPSWSSTHPQPTHIITTDYLPMVRHAPIFTQKFLRFNIHDWTSTHGEFGYSTYPTCRSGGCFDPEVSMIIWTILFGRHFGNQGFLYRSSSWWICGRKVHPHINPFRGGISVMKMCMHEESILLSDSRAIPLTFKSSHMWGM